MGVDSGRFTRHQIEKELTAKAVQFRFLEDRLNRLPQNDPETAVLRHDAFAAIREGRFDVADQRLANAEIREIIRAKRDGETLPPEAINTFVSGLSDGRIADAQAAALAMAILFRPLHRGECVALARSLAESGTCLRWHNLPGPALDKHSTGGMGDALSLPLAAAVAACGGYAAMLSGRGLGHIGGTIDKLEAIPGYITKADLTTFQRVVRDVGCAIVGTPSDLAPADRRLYAIRDITASVDPCL